MQHYIFKSIIARVNDHSTGQWWCKYYGCTFKVISVRVDTVLVKANVDEGYTYPYNIHELPRSAVEFIAIGPIQPDAIYCSPTIVLAKNKHGFYTEITQ